MKRNVKFLTALLVVVLAVTLVVGLSACDKKGPSQAQTDVLIVGSTADIKTLNRLEANGGEPGYAYDILAASLTQLTPIYQDGKEYKPLLCDFEVSQDEKVYSFKVKDGFTWHDGKPVTNQDLVFTLSNAVDKTLNAAVLTEADGKVILTLESPKPNFLGSISSLRLYPKHLFEITVKELVEGKEQTVTRLKHSDELSIKDSVVGCGPFKHILYDTNKGILQFEKFDKYPYASNITINKVIVKFYEQADVMNLALKNGEIDMTYDYQRGLSSAQIKDLSKQSNISLISFATKRMPKNLFFNVEKIGKEERQAIRKAIDYEELRRIFGSSEVGVSNEGFIPNNVSVLETKALDKADIEGAKAILQAKGYTADNKFQFKLLVNSSKDDSQYADILKTQIEKTGLVNVTIDPKGASGWKETIINGEHMACLATVTAKGFDFAAGFCTKYLLARNTEAEPENPVCFSNYKLKEGETLTQFGKIFYALQNAGTAEEYTQAVTNYQQFIVDESPVVALFMDTLTRPYSNKLSGFFLEGGFDIFNVKTFETLRKAA